MDINEIDAILGSQGGEFEIYCLVEVISHFRGAQILYI